MLLGRSMKLAERISEQVPHEGAVQSQPCSTGGEISHWQGNTEDVKEKEQPEVTHSCLTG